jgi:hypothetical protein
VWWDPDLAAQIARAGASGRIASYQVCDWMTPLSADSLLSRGYMGDGHIDFAAVTRLVTDAGYDGDIEVEIFRQEIWDAPYGEVAARVVAAFEQTVAPSLSPVEWGGAAGRIRGSSRAAQPAVSAGRVGRRSRPYPRVE